MCYLFGVKYEIMPVSAMFDNSREKEEVARGLERQDSLSCMQDTNVLTKWTLCKVFKIIRQLPRHSPRSRSCPTIISVKNKQSQSFTFRFYCFT